MSKLPLPNDSFNYRELTVYGLAMTLFSFLIAWGLELLAKEFIRLG